MEKYTVVSAESADGKALIRRVSDGKVSRCKLSWLVKLADETYQAKSKTKAIRMDGLEWTTEG